MNYFFPVDCIVIVMYSEIIFDIIVLIIVAEGLPAPTISWLVNGSQIGRQVMDKNFKIRGLRSQSELFVLPSSDRWYCTIPAKKEKSILHIHSMLVSCIACKVNVNIKKKISDITRDMIVLLRMIMGQRLWHWSWGGRADLVQWGRWWWRRWPPPWSGSGSCLPRAREDCRWYPTWRSTKKRDKTGGTLRRGSGFKKMMEALNLAI